MSTVPPESPEPPPAPADVTAESSPAPAEVEAEAPVEVEAEAPVEAAASADPDPDDDRPRRPSNRQRQRETAALLGLAKSLVEMKPSQLAQVPLPDDVREAVLVCRGLGRGPRVRQLRRVAQLLRVHDLTEIGAAAADAGHKQRRRASRERVYEQWRERLVTEGDPALTEFIDEHPMADPPRLRQLLRAARRDPGSGKSRQALLAVLRLIREVCEAEDSVRRGSEGDTTSDDAEA